MTWRIEPLASRYAPEASALVLESFAKFNAAQYEDPTRFTRTATPAAIAALCDHEIVLGAFDEMGALIGIAALSGPDHLELLFVRGSHHRRGVARALWEAMARRVTAGEVSVNASDYAVPAYEALGFVRVRGVIGSHGREINRMIWRAS